MTRLEELDEPGHLDGLAIRRRLGRLTWDIPVAFGDGWMYRNRLERGQIIATYWPFDGEWIHASISFADRMPEYEDLKTLHRGVFDEAPAYQCFVPPAEHINVAEHALHLWGRYDGTRAMPDFGRFGLI